jgi:HPt (histidine-containing phosphotransfer) domain-containing protein/CheY-like chemotaxis protein
VFSSHDASTAADGAAAVARGLRVLVADPSRVVQKIAVALLEERGHSVAAVGTLRELEQLAGELPFDVVVVDDSFADASSDRGTLSVFARFGAGTRRIWLTVGGQDGTGESPGPSEPVISKPFQPQELVAAVEYEPSDTAGKEPIPDQVLDWEAAVKELQGRDDVLRDLAGTFFAECDSLMKQIRESLAAADAAKLRRAAHTLKGAANMFCAKATSVAARNLEYLARDSRLDEAAVAWEVLQREVGRLIPQMHDRTRV